MADSRNPGRSLRRWRAPRKDKDGNVRCAGRYLNPEGCLKTIGKTRVTWCSQDCVDFCMFQTHPGFARTQIFKRDEGICNECGLDVTQMERIMEYANKTYVMLGHQRPFYSQWEYRRVWLRYGCTTRLLTNLGYTPFQSLWQLDHVIELADGGSHEPHNCQTLCVPCHKAKTALMRRMRVISVPKAEISMKKVIKKCCQQTAKGTE